MQGMRIIAVMPNEQYIASKQDYVCFPVVNDLKTVEKFSQNKFLLNQVQLQSYLLWKKNLLLILLLRK